MPTKFLIASLVGLAITLNARRASRFPLLVVPAFFASWLVIELAPQLLLLLVSGVAIFAYRGGLTAWPGWLATAITVLTGYLLWGLVRESYRTDDVLENALCETIGQRPMRASVAVRDFAFPLKLWTTRVHRVRNIPYVAGGRRRVKLDIWTDGQDAPAGAPSEKGKADRPCLLYVPGGAWMVGISNKNQQGKPLLIEMATKGWVCFSMNYPVSPRAKFPDHIIAVKRAIAWIREHARDYGGDARFLMVAGNSAGGHLSSLAALTPNDPEYQPGFEDADTTVQAAVPLYGIYDLTGAMLDELPRRSRLHKAGMLRYMEHLVVGQRLEDGRPVFEKGSPWHRVGPNAPPFFVIHGAMDTLALADEAHAFANRLRAVSEQPVVYAELPQAQHAFDQFLSIRTLHVVRAIARFGEWAYDRWKRSEASSGNGATAAPREQQSGRALRNPTSPS